MDLQEGQTQGSHEMGPRRRFSFVPVVSLLVFVVSRTDMNALHVVRCPGAVLRDQDHDFESQASVGTITTFWA